MGSYLAHGLEIYPKAHENPRAFSFIFGPIFLESSIQCPWGVGFHQAKGKEKEEKDSSKKIVKKENHFATKGDIKRALLLKQSFYLLLSRETSLSTRHGYKLVGGRHMNENAIHGAPRKG